MLTIGFGRRFATYKRATLLFDDPEWLKQILSDPHRPALFIFAGRAHPADVPGQELIRRVAEIARMPELEDKLLLVEGYDLRFARRLVSGVDVWLNNPVHPLEASDEQRGANEQHDRERDLAGDEHALHTLASSDAAAAAAREGISAAAACRLQRRREREQQRRRDTARKRQNDEPQIEANIGNSRQFRRRGAECGDAPVRDEQTGGGADDREHDTFDEQLADERPAMRRDILIDRLERWVIGHHILARS